MIQQHFLLALLCLQVVFVEISAQSPHRNSRLRKTWYNTDLPDSLRLKAGDTLGTLYANTYPDSMLSIGREMEACARRIGSKSWQAVAHNRIGRYYFMTGNFDSALVAYREGFRFSESESARIHVKLYSDLGLLFATNNQLDSAIHYISGGIALVRKYKQHEDMLNLLYGNLAECYVEQGKYLEALQCQYEGIKYGSNHPKVLSALNIGRIFQILGMREEARASFEQAFQLAQQAKNPGDVLKAYTAELALAPDLKKVHALLDSGIKLAEMHHLDRAAIDLVAEGANVYVDSLQLPVAAAYIKKALSMADKLRYQFMLNRMLLLSARLQRLQGHHRQSLGLCRQVKPAFERDGATNQLHTLYDVLSKNFEALGQIDSALYYLRQKEIIAEKLDNKALIRAAVSTYLKEKTEQERIRLQLEQEKIAVATAARMRLSNWVFSFILFLLLASATAYYIYGRQKMKAAARLERVNEYLRAEQKRLRRNNQKLRRFSGIVSHDIISNLDLILSAGNVLAGPEASKENLVQYRNITQDSSRRLKNYCLGLMEEARRTARANLQALHDPVPQVHAVLAHFGPALHAARFRVEPGELSPAPLPAPVVEQVFHNLISNALRHGATAPEPVLRIREEQNEFGHSWVLEDNGPGLKPGQAAAIFDAPATFSTGTEGQRMGLRLLRDTLQEYGTDIRAEATPGGGARFVVVFSS